MAQDEFDYRGLKCPLPALMAKKQLAAAAPGDEILVVTDDPMAPVDIPHMCHREGHTVVTISRDGDVARIVLKRRA